MSLKVNIIKYSNTLIIVSPAETKNHFRDIHEIIIFKWQYTTR